MNPTFLDKFGAAGVLLTALACPACWPLFASAGSALGLGILLPYEPLLMTFAFPGFMGVTLLGSVLSFRFHKKIAPLVLGVTAPILALYGFYFGWILWLMYTGIFGSMIAAVLSYLATRRERVNCQCQ